ncbi:hypothetical protein EV643_104164 [Kribbella sp. VKM Ac-2527]|uniref:Uncharacterized protein n=1 Tax=Kribbella caucasensis TaxID=2512215 RepID=A0A4R6KKK2_9ACTN|nr:hypothetical protein [Kribbella sp. VKM Ac-2527]TDO50671.1 hypothetical protein EV643_104164 [Kribbella sp. VKM Ac-2527]
MADDDSTSDDESKGGSTGEDEAASKDGEVDETKVRNCTADRLRLVNAKDEAFVFAPLEKRTQPDAARWPLQQLFDREILVAVEPSRKRDVEWILQPAGGAAGIAFLVAIYVADANPIRQGLVWGIVAGIYVLLFAMALVVALIGGPAVARQAGQFATLFLVILISVGVPAAVAWRYSVEGLFAGTSLADLGRLLQVSFVSLACLVPGLLFFLFDRQRLSTLRDRFEQQIFRLDPNVDTLADAYTRYGKQIEETYGHGGDRTETRLERQRRWPIVVATIALALGWVITLLPVGELDDPNTPAEVAALFVPQQNAVAFGFLGAYFFAINLILRRYARGDLRPKAYTTITVRILVVVILGWLVDAIAPGQNDWILVVAFLIGIVPETVLTFLREIYRGPTIGTYLKPLDEPLPLHDLEGIDLYDRARLLDEGVANIEALAHHDFIDLLLETRIPAARLVDWVDQAILYLHVAGPTANGKHTSPAARANLRRLGIRTATDLQTICTRYPSGPVFNQLGQAVSDGQNDDNCTLNLLLASLQDDEWMNYVHSWRSNAVIGDRTINLADNGTITTDNRTVPQPPSG